MPGAVEPCAVRPFDVPNATATLDPDYGMGKEVQGLIPDGAECIDRKHWWQSSCQLDVGDRVFMDHLRGGVYARILSVTEDHRVLGRVVATRGLIKGVFIDEVIQVPKECVAKILKA